MGKREKYGCWLVIIGLGVLWTSVLNAGREASWPVRAASYCRRALIAAGFLSSPFEIRAHRLSVRRQIELHAEKYTQTGVPWADALERASRQFLVDKGFEPELVDRWRSWAPEYFRRVLLEPRNEPVVRYRQYRGRAENFSLAYQTSFPAVYVLDRDPLVAPYIEGTPPSGYVDIHMRLQVPRFALARVVAGIYEVPEVPIVRIPGIDPSITRDPRLFVTHLRFVGQSKEWIKASECINDFWSLSR